MLEELEGWLLGMLLDLLRDFLRMSAIELFPDPNKSSKSNQVRASGIKSDPFQLKHAKIRFDLTCCQP